MYKTIAIMLLTALTSVALAQEFSFNKPPVSTNPSSSSSSMTPAREPTLSSTDFANSSVNAYQEQQAKVSALAAQQLKDTQMNRAASIPKPAPGTMQKPAATIEPPKSIINQEHPAINANPLPAAATPPATQPYTGFQNPSTSTPNRPAPNNNQNSSGWGSSIKY